MTWAIHAMYAAVITILIILLFAAGAAPGKQASAVLAQTAKPRPEPLRNWSPEALAAPRSIVQYRGEIDALIRRAIALGEFGPLTAECWWALTGGKRLRAIIVLEVARAAGGLNPGRLPADLAEVALAVEYVQAASLVVDDLPSHDNDPTRRGRPSTHTQFGEARAQLAAVGLASAAIQCLGRQVDWTQTNRPDLDALHIGATVAGLAANTLGAEGLAGGQRLDLVSVPRNSGAILDLHIRKTARLFELAVAAAWLFSGGAAELTPRLRSVGRHLGLAFQLADDLGDAEADAARGSPNYANTAGKADAEELLLLHLTAAELGLQRLRLLTSVWETGIFPAVWAMAG